MATSKISVSFSADLQMSLNPACSPSPGSPTAPTAYVPRLLSRNLQASVMAGSILTVVSTPASYTSLGVPANLQGTAVYVRSLAANEELSLRVTLDSAGQVVLPLKGMLLWEPTDDDFITALEIQGEGSVEWALWGDLA